MNEIDTLLFIDIIQDNGAHGPYDCREVDGDRFEAYIGVNGNKVQICSSDEFLTKTVANEYCRQLGLNHLIGKI